MKKTNRTGGSRVAAWPKRMLDKQDEIVDWINEHERQEKDKGVEE